MLVDISSQHAHQSLMNDNVLLSIVDEYSDSEKELDEYREKYFELKENEKKLKETKEQIAKSIEEADYIRFCLNELDNADLKEGEEESLKEDIQIMSSSEYLREALSGAEDELRQAENALASSLQLVKKAEKKDLISSRIYKAVSEIKNA